MTQPQFAERIGISQAYVSALENGERNRVGMSYWPQPRIRQIG